MSSESRSMGRLSNSGSGLIKRALESLPENNRLERIWKLAQIDFKRRYYNDRLGLLWALINPIFQISVYYLVFTRIMVVDKENYALFLFSGILIWTLFAEASKKGMFVLKNKRYLIENIQFEKVDLFVSQTISVFMGFFFNLIIYLLLALILGVDFSLKIFFIIPILLTVFLLCMASGLILATLIIYFDDTYHLWDMILFVGFWASGIIFPVDIFVSNNPYFVYLNPFIGILDNTRAILLYNVSPDYYLLGLNFVYAVLLLVFSVYTFKRNQHMFLEKQ